MTQGEKKGPGPQAAVKPRRGADKPVVPEDHIADNDELYIRDDEGLLEPPGAEPPLLPFLSRESLFMDIVVVLRSSWLPALVVGTAFGVFAAYVLIKDGYNGPGHGFIDGEHPLGWDEAHQHGRKLMIHGTRRIPTATELEQIAEERLGAETTLHLPDGAHVSFMALARPGIDGHTPMPEIFYDSVLYGISAADPAAAPGSRVVYTKAEAQRANEELRRDLEGLERPKVSAVYQASTRNGKTGWEEAGLVVRFRFDDMREQGFKGETDRNGTLWEPATQAMLKLGRKHQQLAMYQWYPYQWGVLQEGNKEQSGSSEEGGTLQQSDSTLHWNVLQLVVPVRTGLSKLRSAAVVWRTQ